MMEGISFEAGNGNFYKLYEGSKIGIFTTRLFPANDFKEYKDRTIIQAVPIDEYQLVIEYVDDYKYLFPKRREDVCVKPTKGTFIKSHEKSGVVFVAKHSHAVVELLGDSPKIEGTEVVVLQIVPLEGDFMIVEYVKKSDYERSK